MKNERALKKVEVNAPYDNTCTCFYGQRFYHQRGRTACAFCTNFFDCLRELRHWSLQQKSEVFRVQLYVGGRGDEVGVYVLIDLTHILATEEASNTGYLEKYVSLFVQAVRSGNWDPYEKFTRLKVCGL